MKGVVVSYTRRRTAIPFGAGASTVRGAAAGVVAHDQLNRIGWARGASRVAPGMVPYPRGASGARVVLVRCSRGRRSVPSIAAPHHQKARRVGWEEDPSPVSQRVAAQSAGGCDSTMSRLQPMTFTLEVTPR